MVRWEKRVVLPVRKESSTQRSNSPLLPVSHLLSIEQISRNNLINIARLSGW